MIRIFIAMVFSLFWAISSYGLTPIARGVQNIGKDETSLIYSLGSNERYFSYIYGIYKYDDGNEDFLETSCGYVLYDLKNFNIISEIHTEAKNPFCLDSPLEDGASYNLGIPLRSFIQSIAHKIEKNKQKYKLIDHEQYNYLNPIGADIMDNEYLTPLCPIAQWSVFVYKNNRVYLQKESPPLSRDVKNYCAALLSKNTHIVSPGQSIASLKIIMSL